MNKLLIPFFSLALAGTVLSHSIEARSAEILLPQERTAFYATESVEVAVAGLPAGATASVQLTPQTKGISPFKFQVRGDGSTVNTALPPLTLAPGEYSVSLDGQVGPRLTIASGVNFSTMLLSQTGAKDVVKASGNFQVMGGGNMGRIGANGLPIMDARGRVSESWQSYDRAVAANLPSLLYQYWTGFVTHKPWGAEKSWAAPDMVHTMRLFNLHTAQRMRRFAPNIISVGTLDEPGLAYGRGPAGGFASGIPSWDERAWYESRGWDFTNDPAARPDADWIKYLGIRTDIIKQNNQWAKEDWNAVLPGTVFSTDIYAPIAITDGTDPMNQEVNDIPATHIFPDFQFGKLGIISNLYVEKAHDPVAKVAHAMNGQLVGERAPQPNMRDNYRLALNALLAAGLDSNWWLNVEGMSDEDLASVNEPGQRLGPLFHGVAPATHDVAVLWSRTELAMREKPIVAAAAQSATGEQIKLMIAAAPEANPAGGPAKTGEVAVGVYDVGLNYSGQVTTAHQALLRAGYPAHVVHEQLLPRGVLQNYKTLVIIGQTFALPAEVQAAIAAFQARDGKVVVDKTTTVPMRNALVTEADLKDVNFRRQLVTPPQRPETMSNKAFTYFQTNYFLDEPARHAALLLKATMQKTDSQPALTTDSLHLAVEKHVGGEGSLYMVLNGYEKLPDIQDEQNYLPYNYAPYQATYALKGLQPGSVVYEIEGADWKQVSREQNPILPQTESFAAGEMKLYLVAPRTPTGLNLTAQARGGALAVSATLQNLKMPWPLTVTISAPNGTELYRGYRATGPDGHYSEEFPLGTNAATGTYGVRVESPVANLAAQAKVALQPVAASPAIVTGNVRTFDEATMRNYLAQKPNFVIAIGSPAQQSVANRIATSLNAQGINAQVKREQEIIKKVHYPRVWDPYITVYVPTANAEEKQPSGEVKSTVTVDTGDNGLNIGRRVGTQETVEDWKQPNTLVVVGEKGLADLTNTGDIFYEPGVKFYVNQDRRVEVLNATQTKVQSTEEVRRKWSRPWSRLQSYGGSHSLTPQLPEAYDIDVPLILLGDNNSGELVRAIQDSELLPQIADAKYPGPGKALLSFAWSPFSLGKNVIVIGAADAAGLNAGATRLIELATTRK